MRMDATQRGWAWFSLGFFLVSGIVYAFYAVNATAGPRGGSAMGLAFGIVGFAFMIFAALLGARKRVPTWRLGRAQAWMRGHLWLGLLSLPLILFHGGFHFGGTLTRLLMWLLIITVASGLFGAALQHFVPRLMTTDVPLETIYDEIGNVRRSLREEADRAVEALCGSLGFAKRDTAGELRAGGFTAEQSAPLTRFYLQEMRVFLEEPMRRGQRLGDAEKAKSAFAALQMLLPATARDTLMELEEICGEARQLRRQERLHRWLHGWLLVHIPLSLALILLGAVHAVVALRY